MKSFTLIVAMGALAVGGCQKQNDTTLPSNSMTPPLASSTPPAASATAPALPAGQSLGQSSDSKSEVRMDVVEAVRSGGVLTVKTRFTLVAGKTGSRVLPGSSASEVYLQAADKKYMLLKDDHDKELMASNGYPSFDQLGATQTWWGKYPAPGPEVKAINFFFYGFDPVENVAITDR